MTKEEYLQNLKEVQERQSRVNHRRYTEVVSRWIDHLNKKLEEGASYAFMSPEARGAKEGNIIYSPKAEECLNKAKELYPWLDIEVHWKDYGDIGCTLRVIE